MRLTYWWLGVLGLLFCLGYYSWTYWGLRWMGRVLAQKLGLTRRIPLWSATFAAGMPFYGLPGVLVYVACVLIAPSLITPLYFTTWGVIGGVVLGMGYVAVGSTLAQMVVSVLQYMKHGESSRESLLAEFEKLGSTGWFRGYTLALRVWPRLGFLLAAFSITGEELAFRGVMFPLILHSLGLIPAVLATIIAFMGIQVITMSSWEPALIPVSSSFIIGCIQTSLVIARPDMLPLIVSHYIFFILLRH